MKDDPKRSRLEARAIIMAIRRELAEFKGEMLEEVRRERECDREDHLREYHPESRGFRPPKNLPVPFADVRVPYDSVSSSWRSHTRKELS